MSAKIKPFEVRTGAQHVRVHLRTLTAIFALVNNAVSPKPYKMWLICILLYKVCAIVDIVSLVFSYYSHFKAS